MKQKKLSGILIWTGTQYKKINFLCLIFTALMLISNFMAPLMILGEPILKSLLGKNILILFPFFIILLIFQFLEKYEIIGKIVHIIIALSASIFDIQTNFDSVFGLLFWLMGVMLAYSYKFLDNRKIIKIIFFCLFLFINVQTSSIRAGYYMAGIIDLIFFLFFLFIVYILFKEELDKIFRQEIRFRNENAKLINEKKELQNRIEQDQIRMAELEKYYKDYMESQKPFDLERAGISSGNIELIRTFVTGDKSYKDVADECEMDPGTLRQRIYRINNKIGLDSLEELKQLCQFNWPESAGRY